MLIDINLSIKVDSKALSTFAYNYKALTSNNLLISILEIIKIEKHLLELI